MKSYRIQIVAIAIHLFIETLRNRIFISMIAMGATMFFVSQILGIMAIGGKDRILQSAGFWIIGIWGLLSSLVLGLNIIQQEIKMKTLYTILSRPVNRTVFILGKFTGMVSVMSCLFVLLVLIWSVQLWIAGIQLTTNHFIALGFIFSEWIILASFSLLFASFTSSVLQAFFLTAIYYLGHWSNSLYLFAKNTDNDLLNRGLTIIYYLFPNLESINFRNAAFYGETISLNVAFQGGMVAIFWSITTLLAAILIFNSKRML